MFVIPRVNIWGKVACIPFLSTTAPKNGMSETQLYGTPATEMGFEGHNNGASSVASRRLSRGVHTQFFEAQESATRGMQPVTGEIETASVKGTTREISARKPVDVTDV